jgi:hypothetical protein
MQEIINRAYIDMLRVVAFALDAAVDSGVEITEEQYGELLMEAGRRMRTDPVSPPAYPEMFDRVVAALAEEHGIGGEVE